MRQNSAHVYSVHNSTKTPIGGKLACRIFQCPLAELGALPSPVCLCRLFRPTNDDHSGGGDGDDDDADDG